MRNSTRQFQRTIAFLLVVIFLTGCRLAVFHARVGQAQARVVAVRWLPNEDDGGALTPRAVVRIENVGRGCIWVSGGDFVTFLKFDESCTSLESYSAWPLQMTRLTPGESIDVGIPLEMASREKNCSGHATQICVSQIIASRRRGATEVAAQRTMRELEMILTRNGTSAQIHWSGKLDVDGNITTPLQPLVPAGVNLEEVSRRLR